MIKTKEEVDYRSRYAWVAAALLIAALILGAFAAISPVAAGSDPIQKGIDADAARYQALSEFYLAQEDAIHRGIDADAARYQASGEFYLAQAGGDLLAANPELILARRFYRAPVSVLAANPELILARRGYSQSAVACSLDYDKMVDDPELMLARRVSASC